MQDEKIIDLFFERSEEAILALEQKYGKLCRQISANILGDSGAVEECLNDSWLGVWNTIPPERPRHLGSFVCRIVRNLSLKRYRRDSAQKRNSQFDTAFEELQECLHGGSSAERQLEQKELVKSIEGFLDSLNQENRVIFLRRYWFSDSYEAIARRTGRSEKAISVRLVRLREKLRRYLTERGILE